jgi:hypothetical protein
VIGVEKSERDGLVLGQLNFGRGIEGKSFLGYILCKELLCTNVGGGTYQQVPASSVVASSILQEWWYPQMTKRSRKSCLIPKIHIPQRAFIIHLMLEQHLLRVNGAYYC